MYSLFSSLVVRLVHCCLVLGGVSAVVTMGHAVSFEPLYVKLGDPDGERDHWDPQNRVATESAEFSPDGRFFATVSKSRISEQAVVTLWEAESGEAIWTRTTGGETEAVTFSRDGEYVLTGGETMGGQGSLKIWRVEDGSLARAVSAPFYAKSIEGMRFSPDGMRLATGDEASQVTIWDTSSPDPRSWEIQSVLNVQDTDSLADVNQVDWTNDNRYLVTAERDGDVNLYDAHNLNSQGLAKWVRKFEGFNGKGSVKSVRLSSDNRLVAAGCGSMQGVRLWDFATGRLIAHIPSGSAPENLEKAPLCAERFETVAFTKDSKFLLVGGTWPSWAVNQFYDVPISVFRVDNLESLKPGETPRPVVELESWRTEYIDLSPSGNLMLTSHDDGTVRLWSMSNPASSNGAKEK